MKLKLLAIAILLILTLNKIQAQIPSYIPKDSLVGWWPFDGNANDLSGNNNHGDTFNLTPTADRNSKLNSAYLFNGVSSYIKIPKSQKNGMTSNWTVTAWIYTNGFNGVSQYQTLFSKRNDGIWAHSLALSYTGGTSENEYVVAGRRDQAQNIDLKYSSDKFFKNKWIHLTTTCKNDTIRYYFDGKQIGNFQVFNIQVPNQDVDISIGRICACPSGHPEWFNGKIDDIGLWSRPLDSNEVKSIYFEKNSTTDNYKNSNSKIKVYPNPAKDHLVIDFGNYYSITGYEINIFDVAGKSVYSSTINKSSETIDLNTWNGKGVYFLKIYDKLNQQIENRKIVIQ